MSRPGFNDVTLLTGYPSFLAKHVAEELLSRNPRAFVHAIVRGKSEAEAEAHRQSLDADKRDRLCLVSGDSTSIDLGLSGAEHRALCREVDHIHHAAQATYQGVDRQAAEQLNITGTREILDFASNCTNLKCLAFHSTALVAGDRRGVVSEDELEGGQSFRNVIEETKARGEKLVRAAMARIPIAVLRPSIIVGDSTKGEVDRLDGPYLLIVLLLTSPPDVVLPLPGRGDTPLNLVPIDYVARAACTIATDSRSKGRTFHLVDPAPLTARRVFELVALAGGRRAPRGSIPANVARALLRTPGLERLAHSPREFLDALVTPVSYSSSNTRMILEGTGVACPPFESYVEVLVEHVKQRLKDKRTRKDEGELGDTPPTSGSTSNV